MSYPDLSYLSQIQSENIIFFYKKKKREHIHHVSFASFSF